MNILNCFVDTLGTIIILIVTAILFGPYLVMAKIFGGRRWTDE